VKYKGASKLIAAVSAMALIGVAAGGVIPASASSKTTITVAYPSAYAFDTDQLATNWWNQVKADFTKEYPNVTVDYIPLPGSYSDVVNKLSLLYRSPSTAPDVAEMPSAQIGLYSSSDYLLSLNKYLKTSTWFQDYPKVIQSEGEFSGKIYAVNDGENDSALMYNETMFKKAGIPVPWKPTTWADIISAAQKIKKAYPSVVPLWLNAGTGSGANGLLQGINNFIVGSSTPTIQTSGGKMVVDSPGIAAALGFYQTVYKDGLGASESALFSPNAVTDPLAMFKSGKLAIAVGSNYYGGNWTKFISAPYWPQAVSTMGVANLPNEAGNGWASTLAGWDLAVSSHAPDPTAAFNFINVAQDPTNLIDAANWAGWVPPVSSDWTVPSYTTFAPPYNADFAKILPFSTETPTSANYPVWVQGMGEATGDFVQNPNTTVKQALTTLENYVTEQLGSSEVATLK
jgi:multiple sugar transport system substrate-binding protein